ncbi:MAG TPA: L-serine ammonia-lyase, iron-sulfur-dependent, subunit alpha [Bacteroidota bacterium]|nr:L-serine ammonia-lyase, iron-sulfur-dependent, subunit alpha [Bacteroidota bacterium]
MKRIKIKSFSDVKKFMSKNKILDLSEFFILYEYTNEELSRDVVISRMQKTLNVMRDSIKSGLVKKNVTKSSMISGGAYLMNRFIEKGNSLLSKEFSEIIRNSLAVSEANACMKKIVAAPTAGAAGVIPGALFKIAEKHNITDSELIKSLFVAGGIGEVISIQASLSGAVHGCQAEVGSASAMTAGAITYLFNNDVEAIESAAAFALKNILGLVCDPIAGLVEIPCVKRNVNAALNSIASAEMALSGIRTIIPLDEVIKAMAEIGNKMSDSLKETSLGGLAACETAKRISSEIKNY